MFLITILMTILSILIGVAFLTLMERKVLQYMQMCKGPNKVGFIGVLQSFSDAIKLFSKEHTMPVTSNYMIYITSPIMCPFNALLIWSIFPYLIASYNLGTLLIFLFILYYKYSGM